MKTHFLSPYTVKDQPAFTMCNKSITGNTVLVMDPKQITCKTCQALLKAYLEARARHMAEQLTS